MVGAAVGIVDVLLGSAGGGTLGPKVEEEHDH